MMILLAISIHILAAFGSTLTRQESAYNHERSMQYNRLAQTCNHNPRQPICREIADSLDAYYNKNTGIWEERPNWDFCRNPDLQGETASSVGNFQVMRQIMRTRSEVGVHCMRNTMRMDIAKLVKKLPKMNFKDYIDAKDLENATVYDVAVHLQEEFGMHKAIRIVFNMILKVFKDDKLDRELKDQIHARMEQEIFGNPNMLIAFRDMGKEHERVKCHMDMNVYLSAREAYGKLLDGTMITKEERNALREVLIEYLITIYWDIYSFEAKTSGKGLSFKGFKKFICQDNVYN